MRTSWKVLWLALAAMLIACEQSATVVTTTQVLVSLNSTDSALLSSVTTLRVRASLRLGANSWRKAAVTTVSTSGVAWPVDIPVLPRNASEAASQFEVVAEALADGRVLAETRAITGFRQGKLLALPLLFFACPGRDPVCSPGCLGFECNVCSAQGACDPVREIDPESLFETMAVDPAADSGAGGDSSIDTPAATGAMRDGSVTIDGSTTTTDGGVASEPNPPIVTGPVPECSASIACPAGFMCVQMKCASLCTQTQCDPNATCSLLDGAATCTCNGGYIATSGTGTSVKCTHDTPCEQLGCDANASCQMRADQTRECVCKNGYMGSGTSCAPVSCPQPTMLNGTVSTPEGVTFGRTATYRCDSGYVQAAGGNWTRTCGANMQWSGTQPSCSQITCPALSNPLNGTVSTPQGREYGDTATYVCNPRHALGGASMRTCGESGWSGSQPTCTATCKNRTLDSGERCDPTASPYNAWTCNDTCEQTTTMYTACTSSAGCGGGLCYSGICGSACSASNPSCPATPTGTGTTPFCLASVGACAPSNCISNSDCAPGLVCKYVSAISSNICSGCSSDAECGGGMTCSLFSTAPNLGHCR